MEPTGRSKDRFLALGQAVCIDAARHIASPRLVLPYLFLAFGGPVLLVGFLLPVVQFVRLLTPGLIWPFAGKPGRSKGLVIG
ncbi:MAG: hypothetical protein VW644_02725, partial [Alphaproteobacteria bacterium]